MKILITEIPEKHPKLVLMFERETGKHAIWGNKITGYFKHWLRQKIKYKTLICSICGKKFRNKKALIGHLNWHKPGYRENHVKKISKTLEGHWTGNKNPMFGKFGKEHNRYKYNNIGYDAIHIRAHKADPKPEDGICELCGKVEDKFGKTKLIHSNKDHSYKLPINPDEWWWIHQSCHMKHEI